MGFIEQDELLMDKAEAIEEKLAPFFKGVEKTAFYNQRKVLAAFRKNKVSDFHLSGSTGYGYDDSGRDMLEQVYADVFGAEACLYVTRSFQGRMRFQSVYFGILRPGDELLYITGKPYDTLESIVSGKGKDTGSLGGLWHHV